MKLSSDLADLVELGAKVALATVRIWNVTVLNLRASPFWHSLRVDMMPASMSSQH